MIRRRRSGLLMICLAAGMFGSARGAVTPQWTLLQSSRHGSAADEEVRRVISLSNGNVAMAGHRPGAGGQDGWVALFNSSDLSLQWEFRLEGSGSDEIRDLVELPSGELAAVGTTSSTDLPTSPGAFQPSTSGSEDGFVLVLGAESGQRTHLTYFGGSAVDRLSAVAAGPEGDLWLAGLTFSDNLPVLRPTQSVRAGSADVCLARLSPDLTTLRFGSYLGGDLADQATALTVLDDVPILAGVTASANFPVSILPRGLRRGFDDGFVAAFNPVAESWSFTTLVGGSSVERMAWVGGDPEVGVLMAGSTRSRDLPGLRPAPPASEFDGFVARLDLTGRLLGTRLLGGSRADEILGGTFVPADDISATPARWTLAGWTQSDDLVGGDSFQPQLGGSETGDALMMVVDPLRLTLLSGTLLGGVEDDLASGAVWDPVQGLLISGQTRSPDFPAPQGAGGSDPWIARLDLGSGSGAELSVSRPRVNFGRVVTGGVGTRTLRIRNRGVGTLTTVIDSLFDPFAVTPGGVIQLGPGEEQELQLRFRPKAFGRFRGAFTLRTNDPRRSRVIVQVTGSGGRR